MTNEEHRPCQCSKCSRATIADLISTAKSNYKNMITFHSTGDVYVSYLSDVVDDLLNAVDAIAEKIR